MVFYFDLLNFASTCLGVAYNGGNSNLVEQIYSTFPTGKSIIICNNVPTVNEW